MTKKSITFQEGDLLAIPHDSGRIVIGRVVHMSKHYKNCIGVVLYAVRASIENPNEWINSLPEHPVGLYYTSVQAATQYRWTVICHHQFSEKDQLLSKRIVGGHIWIGDTPIQQASLEERKTLPSMLVYGMIALYREIEKKFGLEKKSG